MSPGVSQTLSSAGSLTHAGVREGGGEAMSAQSPPERAARARFVWAVPFQLYVSGSSIQSQRPFRSSHGDPV